MEVGTAEVGIAEVWRGVEVLVPPSVPDFRASLKQGKVLMVSHGSPPLQPHAEPRLRQTQPVQFWGKNGPVHIRPILIMMRFHFIIFATIIVIAANIPIHDAISPTITHICFPLVLCPLTDSSRFITSVRNNSSTVTVFMT